MSKCKSIQLEEEHRALIMRERAARDLSTMAHFAASLSICAIVVYFLFSMFANHASMVDAAIMGVK